MSDQTHDSGMSVEHHEIVAELKELRRLVEQCDGCATGHAEVQEIIPRLDAVIAKLSTTRRQRPNPIP